MFQILKALMYRKKKWTYELVTEIVKKGYTPKKRIKKIAVLALHVEYIERLNLIWKNLPKDIFEIIYANNSFERDIIRFSKKNGYKHRNITDVLCNKEKYILSVSHNAWFNFELPYTNISNILAEKHFRIMYSLGAAIETLSLNHNYIYDTILCYGPYQKNNIQALPFTDVITVGNPRFDECYFSGDYFVQPLKDNLNLDPRKKTILWLPTMSGFCSSVEDFTTVLEKLHCDYNVLVKPHSLISEKEKKKLVEAKLRIIEDNTLSSKLFMIADFVFCDYGGSAFSAIYTNRNLVLLNVEGVENCSIYGENSPEFYIRKFIKSYDISQSSALLADLKEDTLWEKQKEIRKKLFLEFFDDYKGFSSSYAAKIIMNEFKKNTF